MRRRRTIYDASWHQEHDRLMHEVLAHPERHHPSIVHWAEWRRQWLNEQGNGRILRPFPGPPATSREGVAFCDTHRRGRRSKGRKMRPLQKPLTLCRVGKMHTLQKPPKLSA
jgi:hypothetical protein